MTVIFLLREDSISGKKEGEYYTAKSGVIFANVPQSVMMVNRQCIIATGSKEIKQVFTDYSDYNITEGINYLLK